MQEGFRPELGIRLQAVADLVRKGKCIADIGCDHGFVSIALIQSGAAEFVIACDVKEGPLKAAKEHVAAAGLKDRIDCRLADGLAGLKENEADGIIIAGTAHSLRRKGQIKGCQSGCSADPVKVRTCPFCTEGMGL